MKTALYRIYGHRGALLYVGMSNSPVRRVRRHIQTQPWASLISHYEIEWHESRPEARKAELAAIRDECPDWNKASNRLMTLPLNDPTALIRTPRQIHLEVMAEIKALYGVEPCG